MRRRHNREPVPQGIDDYTGFKVPLSSLKKDWQGRMTVNPDLRNPQDFVRGRADKMALPFSRPEAPDRFMAVNILWEDGRAMLQQDGTPILSEGELIAL